MMHDSDTFLTCEQCKRKEAMERIDTVLNVHVMCSPCWEEFCELEADELYWINRDHKGRMS